MQVTIFGATGPVGTAVAEILSSQYPGWMIRTVSRSTSSSSQLASMNLPNVEMVQADAENLDQVLEVTETSDIIYCCIGLSRYETKYWAATWPVVLDNILKATRGSKKLIFCDNLYAYGTGTISPHKTPVKAGTHSKPAVRTLLRVRLQEHMQDHPGTVAVVGASDFFGPHVSQSFLGDVVIKRIVSDQAPIAFGNKIHDFCFTHDFAVALATVATRPNAYDKFWIAPHSVHGKTMQEVANDVARAALKKPRSLGISPSWIVYMLAPFWGLMYEMKDMLEIWTKDYIVDDSDFITEFGVTATPYKEAIQKTVDFFVKRAEAVQK